MNIIDGLSSFKRRKNYSNIQLSELLGCSTSVVSLYLSGKSGLSLDKLAILLKDGMTLEEAFGAEVSNKIKENENYGSKVESEPMKLVLDGLKAIIQTLEKTI